MTIKELIQQFGFTNQQLADYFNIPLRTIENWKSEKTCYQYIIELLEYKLKNEDLIK